MPRSLPPAQDPPRPLVVIGLVGTVLDGATDPDRWSRWRPTVSLGQQEDLIVSRFDLLHGRRHIALAEQVAGDLHLVSPESRVVPHLVEMRDPWDFADVYESLYSFAHDYEFRDDEDYLVHMTTGTHVAQICLFLLTESRHIPARLVQTSPPERKHSGRPGSYRIIDLDLSRYDRLQARFESEHAERVSFLKAGIETRSPHFNALIGRIEDVALASDAPILLTGETGVGKTQLARRIWELKQRAHQVHGEFVQANCATLHGDLAAATLFGHERGAFTGANAKRAGLLRAAHGGLLFLDEIGELGLDEQAMLLRALEEGLFQPLGSDRLEESRFQLIAGTNRDLGERVRAGLFREDLLARIDLWTFELPPLRQRVEDLEPNLDYELERCSKELGRQIRLLGAARDTFLTFATDRTTSWRGNFRDFAAAITRMATLAPGGRISLAIVEEELGRLRERWRRLEGADTGSIVSGLLDPPRLQSTGARSQAAGSIAAQPPAPESTRLDSMPAEAIGFARPPSSSPAAATPSATTQAPAGADLLERALGADALADLDLFDRAQLDAVLRVCANARSLSAAGRTLFAASLRRRKSRNDADRLRKYLARFGLEWSSLPR